MRRASADASEKDAGNAEDGADGLPNVYSFMQDEKPVREEADNARGDHDWIPHGSGAKMLESVESWEGEVPARQERDRAQDGGVGRKCAEFSGNRPRGSPPEPASDGKVCQRRKEEARIDGQGAEGR